MLQYIATTSDQYTVPELVQMAIEGGCKWVILRLPDWDEAQLRDLATLLVPLCKETGTILTIENEPALARELGLHGVHLRNYPRPALSVREELGPEAIIGVEVAEASSVLTMIAADIDYATFGPAVSIDKLSHNVELLRSAQCSIPVVSEGAYTVETVTTPIEAGASGVAVSSSITEADDPVAATAALLSVLTNR